jgi:hypothetical protein
MICKQVMVDSGKMLAEPRGGAPLRDSDLCFSRPCNICLAKRGHHARRRTRTSPAGLDGSNSAACGISQYKPASDTVIDRACSATLSVPYYQSVAYAGLDGACPPPPGVAKDKSVPDPRLYWAGPTTRNVALD